MLADGCASQRQHQRIATELAALDRLAGEQWMPGTHHQRHRFAVQMLEQQPLDLRAFGHAPDHQIQLADMQLRQQVRTRPGGHADHQGLMTLMQAAQHLRHQQAFDRGQHTDTHLRRRMFLTAQGTYAFTQGLHAGPGVTHETHPGRGQFDTLLAAFEQARLQQLFKLLEGLGDGRLTDRHGIGGLGETALTGNFEKAQQVTEFDAGVEVHPASLSGPCNRRQCRLPQCLHHTELCGSRPCRR
ncbi:hypothetical protein D3C77_492110 [compost metagenome]